jgi:hypothetical protein
MNNELEIIWKEAVVAEFKVEFQHLSQTRTAVSKPE